MTVLAAVAALFMCQQTVPQLQSTFVQSLWRRMDDLIRNRTADALLAPGAGGLVEDPVVRTRLDVVVGIRHRESGLTPGAVVGTVAAVLGQWLTDLGLFCLLGTVRWWLGLEVGLTVGGFVALRFADALGYDLHGRLFALVRRSDYFGSLLGNGGAAKEVRLFGLATWLRDAWEGLLRTYFTENWNLFYRNSAVFTAGLMCAGPGLLIAVGLVAWGAAGGRMTLAQLAIAGQALIQLVGLGFFDPVYSLPLLVPRVPALLELESRVREFPSRGRPVPRVALRDKVRFDAVTFAYPGAPPTLRALDLTIPAGRSLALVGENGSGKTTLVKLLCGFQRPSEGRITVDGANLHDYDTEAWQRRVAAIMQDFGRYPLSVGENVALAEEFWDPELLAAAAADAGALDLVERLASGWDTVLSREFDGGVELSGGEWQRIALARAMVAARSGAELLILDEPAANLDVRGETELNHRFMDITSGLTTVVISHRLSTVRHADRICVLDRGRIREEGDHDTLVRAGGIYAELFELQARQFQEGMEE